MWRRWLWIGGAISLFALISALAFAPAKRFLEEDRCLDRGGTFRPDGSCDTNPNDG